MTIFLFCFYFRACFKRLPRILCFNTMRYTFNMVTMLKEKVNTHFSFPLRLDMSQYMEKNLMGPDKLKGNNELGEKFSFQRSLELFLSLFFCINIFFTLSTSWQLLNQMEQIMARNTLMVMIMRLVHKEGLAGGIRG